MHVVSFIPNAGVLDKIAEVKERLRVDCCNFANLFRGYGDAQRLDRPEINWFLILIT